MNKDTKLVTLDTFKSSFDAHLLKSKLESDGIPCFIFDELTSNLGPHYNQFVGGIKLKVRETDLEKVHEVLKVINDTPLTDQKGIIIKCPKCNSSHIESGVQSLTGIKGFFNNLSSNYNMSHRKPELAKICAANFERITGYFDRFIVQRLVKSGFPFGFNSFLH